MLVASWPLGWRPERSTASTVTAVSPSATYHAAINAVWVAPAGNYVYVGSDSTIAVLSLNSGTGELTPVSGSPFSVMPQVTSFATSPDGRFLYAAECVPPAGANAAAVFCGPQSILGTYAVNAATGRITLAGSQPLPASYSFPQIIAAGSFVFAGTTPMQTLNAGQTAEDYTGRIDTFAADPSTGLLTLKATTTTSGGEIYMLAVPGQ